MGVKKMNGEGEVSVARILSLSLSIYIAATSPSQTYRAGNPIQLEKTVMRFLY